MRNMYFSLTCSNCAAIDTHANDTEDGPAAKQFADVFAYLADRRAAGWRCDHHPTPQPVRCPKCASSS